MQDSRDDANWARKEIQSFNYYHQFYQIGKRDRKRKHYRIELEILSKKIELKLHQTPSQTLIAAWNLPTQQE